MSEIDHEAAVRARVIDVLSGWRAPPPMGVVRSPDQLPGAQTGDTRGFYDGLRTWVVAQNVDLQDVAPTMTHEVIAHHGVRRMLGRGAWFSFMQAVGAGARAGDHMLRAARDHVRGIYVTDSGEAYLSGPTEADETLAAIAETMAHHDTGELVMARPLAKRALALRRHLTREVLLLDVPATAEEVQGALLEAEHRVRYGGKFWGIGWLARAWYRVATMPRWDVHQPPMSLDESQRLLDRSTDWSTAFAEIGGLLAMIAVIVGVAGSVIYFLGLIFGVFKL